jgi:hypothetical protein
MSVVDDQDLPTIPTRANFGQFGRKSGLSPRTDKPRRCDWVSGSGPEDLGMGVMAANKRVLSSLKPLSRKPSPTSASSAMLNLTSRSTQAWRSIRRLAKDMATVAERIGDTKVSMSLLEPAAYINYQRIEDNLAVVRKRYTSIKGIHSATFSH